MDTQALALIPARYASSRFPGKPLADQTGKPLVQHVVERVGQATTVGRVVVATEDQRIAEAVRGFGGQAVLTSAEHPNGTSRLAEALTVMDRAGVGGERGVGGVGGERVIVNVQGDEPEIEPEAIDRLVEALAEHPRAPMATLGSPIEHEADAANPDIVKVLIDQSGHGLYFSRSPIPYLRKPGFTTPIKHVGIYAYRAWFLPVYVGLAPTPLEQSEQLEQLRALEHGYAIAVKIIHAPHPGIDTPEQYQAFVRRYMQAHGH